MCINIICVCFRFYVYFEEFTADLIDYQCLPAYLMIAFSTGKSLLQRVAPVSTNKSHLVS